MDELDKARLRVAQLEDQLVRMRGQLVNVVDAITTGKDVAVLLPGLRRVVGELRERWDRGSILDAYARWVALHGVAPSSSDWDPSNPRPGRHAERMAAFYAGRYPTQATVRAHFGSWNNMVTVAGGQPRNAGAHGGGGGAIGELPQWRGWELLVVYRARLGLTQSALASLANMSVSHIAMMETGKHVNPGVRTVLALAQALDIPPSALVE